MKTDPTKTEFLKIADALESTGSPVYQAIEGNYMLCKRFWATLRLAFELGKLCNEMGREDWSNEIG